MTRTTLLLLAVSGAVLTGCGETPTGPATVVTADPLVRVSPTVGGLGMTIDVELRGVNTSWTDGDVTLDLGPFFSVATPVVDGPNFATAAVTIDGSAPLGFHPITVTFPQRIDGQDPVVKTFELDGADAFLVEPGGITSVLPQRVRLGETLEVQIEGFGTNFQDGVTWADFGEGVYVNWVTAADSTHATASISIDQRADPGWHDIVVFNGPTGYTAMNGIFIERSAVAIQVDPAVGNQGEVILGAAITGFNTHFDGSGNRDTIVDLGTGICVNEFYPDCQDTIEPGGVVEVLAPTVALGDLRISNGALAGFYDVRVYTVERDDFDNNGAFDPGEFTVLEEIVLHDGFEVREVPIDCNDNPGVSFSFSIGRGIDNDTCQVGEQVSASAVFYTPLDPPCGGPPSPPIMPYDIQHVINPPTGGTDCPSVPTCDAGPVVYLESELNTIELFKEENPLTGDIFYIPGRTLTLDDYKFGYVDYDLWADGSEDPTQIPAFRHEDALFTLPANFELLAPSFCDNFTHDPNEDLLIEWTPGNTYDVAGMSMSWSTTDEDDVAWQIVTIPWDDGDHVWPSDWLTAVPEGGGYFGFGAGVDEPKWFFDFGDGPVGLENQGRSGLSYSGFMLLRSETE